MIEQLAIIVPVRDEIGSLEELVVRITKALRSYKISHKIIIVDDHSTDGSWELAKKLQKKYSVAAYQKIGQPGKAFSILEGAMYTQAENIGFIDADLQYPPEVIPEMFAKLEKNGLVIGRRKYTNVSKIREFVSKVGHQLIGNWLYGMPFDIQSGLKLMRREVLMSMDKLTIKPWSLDLPLLLTTFEFGYEVEEIEIPFSERKAGVSKIGIFGTSWELLSQALLFRLQGINPVPIFPSVSEEMLDAGVIHHKRRYITHTTLKHSQSALVTFTLLQKTTLLFLGLILLCIAVLFPMVAAIGVVGLLTLIYFTDVCFNFILILRSLYFPPEVSIPDDQLKSLKNSQLPIYTILCPLYKEAHVLPQFIESIQSIDWPKNKLDVQLLLEADDVETIEAAKRMNLPKFIKINIVPDSQPKTKPKACNYGLAHAAGEFLVIYDAEDRPDPLQLKKVYMAFQQLPANVKCIQAKLNYYNPTQNVLTRLFTAEYSLWFDVILTGLQSIETTIPLGGTSNHFRTVELKQLEGWDPFNVTEDCDLGIRLFKRGGRTAVIDSITYEEANSNWFNWLRQRSRWIKGYIQTYLVHMRHPIKFIQEHGWHAMYFHLSVGGKIAFLFINPLMWVLTISYFTAYAYVGPTIEALYPPIIFYMAVFSLVFGNFMFIYYYMIGVAKREHWSVMKFVFLVPFYWLWTSTAAVIGLYQLIVKPHYWEKTVHGLHLKKQQLQQEAAAVAKKASAEIITETIVHQKEMAQPFVQTPKKAALFSFVWEKFKNLPIKQVFEKLQSPKFRGGILLVASQLIANVLNLLTNLYLGRELKFADFAIMNTYISILYLINIPVSAFSTTINHATAYLLGKYRLEAAHKFWAHLSVRTVFVSTFCTIVWLVLTPVIQKFFNLDSPISLLLFTPLIFISVHAAVNKGYLYGRLMFGVAAVTTLLDPIVRLVTTILVGEFELDKYLVVSIPLAALGSFIVSHYVAQQHEHDGSENIEIKEFRLPYKFFFSALLTGLSSIAFFSLDNILVTHFLTHDDAGKYGVLGLVGKMIFFAGSLTAGFILPLVSHKEGRGEASHDTFWQLFQLTAALSALAYLALGIGLPLIAPYYFGVKINAIREFLPIYGIGILTYTLAQTIIQYHLAKKEYAFGVVSFCIAIVQVLSMWFFHQSLWAIVWIMTGSGILNAVALFTFHRFYIKLKEPLANIQDFFDLFKAFPKNTAKIPKKEQYRILIFNWRDTKHVWAGGAEQYIHEIAKRLVKDGHKVTMMCGNDGKNVRNEVVDQVQIIRRGGFYTVYVWAFLYYMFKFRNVFDIVIDCENGIPFLTPLYVKQPVVLLIHHIHQEVFRNHLPTPFAQIAAIIESDLMPMLYKNQSIITVSNSSKQEIEALGLGDASTIGVVNPGIATSLFSKSPKTKFPSMVYVGRLKPYKNVDIAIRAFAKVVKKFPKAKFFIAGTGESHKRLVELTHNLDLKKNVIFLEKVTDQEKAKLFSTSWVAVQPSLVEGWGITVIEANASGTAVIASDVKGLRDSVIHGKTGMLVNPKNVSAFADAITLFFESPQLRRKFNNKAFAWGQSFDWEKSSTIFYTLLKKKIHESVVSGSKVSALEGGELMYD